MNWLNLDTFFEHGELGIMTLVIILASLLIYKTIKEQGRREERVITAIVNNTMAMQGVKDISKDIKRAVNYCPRRLRVELESAEDTSLTSEIDEDDDDPEGG